MIDKLPLYLLERVYLDDRTLGSIYSPQGGIICKTLELPWLDNKRSVSCIPEGKYHVTKEPPILPDDPDTEEDESGGRHPRPYHHFRLSKVTGRSGILIHRGTEITHSQGCILVASRFKNVQSETPSLEESGVKLKWMTDNMPDEFYLLIEKK
jgi:hypothetical protein